MPTFKNVQITVTPIDKNNCTIKASVDLTVSAAEAAAPDLAKHFVVFLFFRADNNAADFSHTREIAGSAEKTISYSLEVKRALPASGVVNPRLEVKVFALKPTPILHNNRMVVGGPPVTFSIL